MYHRHPNTTPGFTLIELLIIAPIVILVITVFIGVLINMTGDVLASRERNAMTYNAQETLNEIELDARLSSQFLSNTGALPSPQGSDGNTASFTSTTGNASNLILSSFATTTNPNNTSTRSLVYYANQPQPCGSNQIYNTPLRDTIIYFLTGSSGSYTLWRRTVVPTGGSYCGTAWQRNSCTNGSPSPCVTKDDQIMSGIASFSVLYCDIYGNCSAANTPDSSKSIQVTLSANSSVAGISNTTTLTLNASHLNT